MSESDIASKDIGFQASLAGEIAAADANQGLNNASRFYGGPFDAPNWMFDVAHQMKVQKLLSEEGTVFSNPQSEINVEHQS